MNIIWNDKKGIVLVTLGLLPHILFQRKDYLLKVDFLNE